MWELAGQVETAVSEGEELPFVEDLYPWAVGQFPFVINYGRERFVSELDVWAGPLLAIRRVSGARSGQ